VAGMRKFDIQSAHPKIEERMNIAELLEHEATIKRNLALSKSIQNKAVRS
jgi:hypothetical protein